MISQFTSKLNEIEINYLEKEIENFKNCEDSKFNHKEFYMKNYKRLENLLDFVINSKPFTENKIKLSHLEKLINKGKELNFRENQLDLVNI
jgi:hypothetical protein